MELCRVCGPVVADSRHFDEEHDLDQNPYPNQSEMSDPDPHLRGIRVRITKIKIRNHLIC
jgi:hypothetical protein